VKRAAAGVEPMVRRKMGDGEAAWFTFEIYQKIF
jgi:hypothetical protein